MLHSRLASASFCTQTDLGVNDQPLSFSIENPKALCTKVKEVSIFENYVDRCVNKDAEAITLRWAQLNTVFKSEMFLLSRIPVNHPKFDIEWTQALERWKARLNNADSVKIMEFDRNPRLQKESCNLHHILGLKCSGVADVNLMSILKKRIEQDQEARSWQRGLPTSIVYDLLENYLLLKVLDTEQQPNMQARRIVLTFLPELEIKPPLKNLLDQFVEKTKLIDPIRDRVDEMRSRGELDILSVDEIVVEELRKTLTDQRQLASIKFISSQMEFLFFRGMHKILKVFDDDIQLAKTDPSWLFKQGYLLNNILSMADRLQAQKKIFEYQSLICVKEHKEALYSAFVDTTNILMGVIGLVTGVGMFFDLAFVSRGFLFGSMMVSMWTTTGLNLYDKYDNYLTSLRRYGLKEQNPARFTQEEKALWQEIPWTIVNAFLTAPMLVLQDLEEAHRLALLAKDVERAKKLKKTMSLLGNLLFAGNLPLTAIMDQQAYEMLKAEFRKLKIFISN